MRKIIISLGVIITLMIPTIVKASSHRTIRIYPEITFSDTNAICSVVVAADSINDEIRMAIELWEGSICVKTWQVDGSGSASFEETVTVSKGSIYTLVANISINGVSQPRQVAYGTCE